ncbi:MAG: DUF2922 domain-containing protein [Sarcina sp.]
MKNLNLVMSFKTTGGKASVLTLKNVKEGLTTEEIQEAMAQIVESNIFLTPLGEFVEAASAELVEKTVTDMEIK